MIPKQAIVCKMCGDEVEVPVGQVWCFECLEEHKPKDFDL